MTLLLFFSSYCCLRSKRCLQDHGCFVEEEEHGNLNILGSPLAIHQFGKELQMVKINLVSSIPHVGASLCVESSALVCIMEHAVKNTAGRSNCYLIGIEGGLRESIGDFSASSSIEIGLGSIMLLMTYEQRSSGWNRGSRMDYSSTWEWCQDENRDGFLLFCSWAAAWQCFQMELKLD